MPVVPAKAGIQRRGVKERDWLATFLDSGLRRNDGVRSSAIFVAEAGRICHCPAHP